MLCSDDYQPKALPPHLFLDRGAGGSSRMSGAVRAVHRDGTVASEALSVITGASCVVVGRLATSLVSPAPVVVLRLSSCALVSGVRGSTNIFVRSVLKAFPCGVS